MPEKAILRASQRLCQRLTEGPRPEVAARLTKLAEPCAAQVGPDDHWMPAGLAAPQEAQLQRDAGFISSHVRDRLLSWWLIFRRGANTPNWDIASTCQLDGRRGLLLVEAKAHEAELEAAGKRPPTTPNGEQNDRRIRAAMQQANRALNHILPGWHLTVDHHYQLCNRVAWAWKLADLGVPAVLVYLGFLEVHKVRDQGEPLAGARAWEDCLRQHAQGIIPQAAWGMRLDVHGTPMGLLVRSLSEQELG